tara:strand:+ start:4914 stop:6146 length:1233 start_codon:yes stop_codon:yes gene_type:complete
MDKIVEEKKGKIIERGIDIFSENVLECQNGHSFNLLENDIILGKWCDLCTEKIETILKELNISFQKNKKIETFLYQYYISGARNFVIFSDIASRKDMIDNAKKHNFNSIVVDDLEDKKLKEKLWNAIKENIELTTIEKEGKKSLSQEHNCSILEHLGNEKGGEGSVVKRAPLPHPTDRKRMKGYIRVSTVMQVQDGFSLEAQESKICKETEKWNGFLESIYIDRGISGGSMEKRLSLDKMLKSLETGDWIIVNSVSRLARNTKDLLSIVEIIENAGCHLLILDLNLDITSPSGKLILTLIGSQAQFEREITSERVKGVMQHLKKTGNLRTKPPFGWKMNQDHSTGASIHVREEKEQEIINKIRNLRNKYPDLTITNFTEKLNQEHLEPPRKSKKWYHRTVKDIMVREGIK